MYHSISDSGDSGRHPYYRTATGPRVFDEHLKFLHDRGYKTITLGDAVRRLHASEAAEERAVVITFDDGFQDFYSQAFPLLSKYNQSATVFLPTAYIDNGPRKFNSIECLTWGQVRELQKAGIQFGSHTVTHPQLRNLTMQDVRHEIQSSKKRIEDELGSSVAPFSYPYAFPETDGEFRRRLQDVLEECGYENGVSTVIGTANRAANIFFFKRLPVNGCDDRRLFEAKIEGGYDWLHPLQYASKLLSEKAGSRDANGEDRSPAHQPSTRGAMTSASWEGQDTIVEFARREEYACEMRHQRDPPHPENQERGRKW